MNKLGVVSALQGALAVAAGAFAAHALKNQVSATDLLTFKTASQYHLVHAVVCVVIAGIAHILPYPKKAIIAGWLLQLGIIFFSGSLYALVLINARWLGIITPVGGLLFIAGWLFLAWSFMSDKKQSQ